MTKKLYGGIEFGGTKTICAIGGSDGTITYQKIIPTTTVNETLTHVCSFFDQYERVDSVGVGSFGPLDLNPASEKFGYICNAPKPGWSNINLKGMLEAHLKLPVTLDTDVNCAALGEHHYGVAKQVNNFVYLTLGTGIGGSLVMNGNLVHGMSHLEMGHMRIPHENFTGTFKGSCSFHNDCLEGIASGFAMEQRYGEKAEYVTNKEAWDVEAGYIASAVQNLMLTIGPELIVLGGGLTNHSGLIEAIRDLVHQNINGYMKFPNLDRYIIKSSGSANGVRGAITLVM